jgi:hypothetical protein
MWPKADAPPESPEVRFGPVADIAKIYSKGPEVDVANALTFVAEKGA